MDTVRRKTPAQAEQQERERQTFIASAYQRFPYWQEPPPPPADIVRHLLAIRCPSLLG
jgi:hypothetical protein